MALVVTPDTPIALFRIFIDYTPSVGTHTTATLYRGLSATGPWVEIRTVDLLGEQAYTVDNTAPLDTPVWYRSVSDVGTEFIDGPETIVTAGGAGWLRDPGRPWADIELFGCDSADPFCNPPDVLSWVGFEGTRQAVDASLVEILNDERPSDIWARRKNHAGSFRLLSRTLAMMRRVYELFTAGGPLFLQLPPVYGWDDDFVQPLDLDRDYISRDQRRPERLWTAPYRLVYRPVGPIQGATCSNWCAVEDAFPTFADMTAAGGTWGDVAQGTVQC